MKAKIMEWFRGKGMRGKIESNPEFQEAERFGKEYNPKGEVDYSWVQRHSEEEFRQAESRVGGIEAKADSLIKYLGAGSGFIALAFMKAPPWQIIPALALFLAALVSVIRALSPQEHPFLPRTRTALDFADAYRNQEAIASFAAKLAAASVGMEIAAVSKARRVRVGFWLFLLALAWLMGYAAVRSL